MDRVILHVDANCFYASCEMRDRPELRDVPLVVGGDADARRGIVLAKNDLAKVTGIRTAETLWSARQKCPDLVVVPPRMDVYVEMSRRMRELFYQYTDSVEPYGLDEAWLDITRCPDSDGPRVADEIRRRVREELGITVSIGVAFTKVFAKLGSDMKKPDATTVIDRENYRRRVWPLSVRDMLYCGGATSAKLAELGIRTIGQLAATDPDALSALLGKQGEMLHGFANGSEDAAVLGFGHGGEVKSVGNSSTTPRDLRTADDVKVTFYQLAESVAARLREQHLAGRTVQIWVRDNTMESFVRQTKLPQASQLAGEVAQAAIALFHRHYKLGQDKPVRALGISVSDLQDAQADAQTSLLTDDKRHQKLASLEDAMDKIRDKYGYFSIRRAMMLTDPELCGLDTHEHLESETHYQG